MTFLLYDLLRLLLYLVGILLPLLGPFIVLTLYSTLAHKKITFHQKIFASVISNLPLAGIWLVGVTFISSTFLYTSDNVVTPLLDVYGGYALMVGVGLEIILSRILFDLMNSLLGSVIYLTIFAFLLTAPLSVPLLGIVLLVTKKRNPRLLIFNSFLANFLSFLGLFLLVFVIGALIFIGYVSQESL